jgi:hypothetical protein
MSPYALADLCLSAAAYQSLVQIYCVTTCGQRPKIYAYNKKIDICQMRKFMGLACCAMCKYTISR